MSPTVSRFTNCTHSQKNALQGKISQKFALKQHGLITSQSHHCAVHGMKSINHIIIIEDE